jgi:hypothetical protein
MKPPARRRHGTIATPGATKGAAPSTPAAPRRMTRQWPGFLVRLRLAERAKKSNRIT